MEKMIRGIFFCSKMAKGSPIALSFYYLPISFSIRTKEFLLKFSLPIEGGGWG
jgi:hypothetical protein